MTQSCAQEWQVAGIKQAMASLDRGSGVAHEKVREWVESWGSEHELAPPSERATS